MFLQQGYLFLLGYVRYLAAKTLSAPTIPELVQCSGEISDMYDYALYWKGVCIKHLAITESELDSAELADVTQNYLDYVTQEGKIGNWLDLHVLMIPAVQVRPVIFYLTAAAAAHVLISTKGYYEVAHKLAHSRKHRHLSKQASLKWSCVLICTS